MLASLQVLLDLSCGSGLFSRRFLQSGQFEKVIASDFSEQMLQQAGRFFYEDVKLDRRYIVLCNVSQLPSTTSLPATCACGQHALHVFWYGCELVWRP